MVILYKTPTCPMCRVLMEQLNKNQIPFEIEENLNILKQKNITHVPVLEYNGKMMDFKEALSWVRGGKQCD